MIESVHLISNPPNRAIMANLAVLLFLKCYMAMWKNSDRDTWRLLNDPAFPAGI